MVEKMQVKSEPTLAADAARLADRTQISELLSRYCAAVDDKHISVEMVAATFMPDGR